MDNETIYIKFHQLSYMKYLLICLLILLILLVSGCTQSSQQTIDCGTNTECIKQNFKQNAASCTPVKMIWSQTQGSVVARIAYEIKGPQAENCILYLKVIEANVTSDTLEISPELAGLEGSEMTCIVPLSNLKDGSKESENFFNPLSNYCQGTYKNIATSGYTK